MSLQYLDGCLATAQEISVTPQVAYPFAAAPIPDVVCQSRTRQYQVDPRQFVRRIGMRSSYTNKLLYTDDLVSSSGWGKYTSGAGVTPVVTAGFPGPNPSSPAWRVQLNDGSPSSGISDLNQDINASGLNNVAISFWYKSNTGSNQTFLFDYDNGVGHSNLVLTATTNWQQYKTVNSTINASPYVTIAASTFAGTSPVVDILVSAIQMDFSTIIGPFIPTHATAVTITVPDIDPDDSLAFLIAESELTYDTSWRATFTRKYCRIPGNQVRPSSKYIQRPVMHDIKSGAYYGVSFDPAQNRTWLFNSRAVATSSTVPGAPAPGPLTSANITFRDGGGRYAILPMNTAPASFAAYLNANLPSLAGTCVAVGGVDYLNLTWTGAMNFIAQPAAVSIGNLTAGSVSFNSTNTADTPSPKQIHSVGHGGAVGNRVALYNGDSIIGLSTISAVLGPDDFRLTNNTSLPADYLINGMVLAKNAVKCIVNGPKRCSIRLTQRFFLPGYTTGITTAADIPAPDSQLDPISWMAAIVAASDYIVESVSDLAQWEGPILMQETSEIQMADAVELITPVPA